VHKTARPLATDWIEKYPCHCFFYLFHFAIIVIANVAAVFVNMVFSEDFVQKFVSVDGMYKMLSYRRETALQGAL